MSKEKNHTIIGIDLGSHSLKMCAVLHSENPNLIPRVLDVVENETESIYRGEIIDEAKLLKEITETLSKFDSKIFTKQGQTFVVGLNVGGINSTTNSGHILTTSLNKEINNTDLDRLEREAATAVAMMKNKKIIYTSPLRYRLDSNETTDNPIGLTGKKVEGKFLFTYSPINYVEKVENTFNNLNLKIEELETGVVAESIPLMNRRQRIAGSALVNLGHSTTSIIVFENDKPIHISVLSVGSDELTRDIALGLQISLEEAEKIKLNRDEFSYSKRKLEDIIEARIENISEKINQELDKINRRELLPGGIILSGGGSKLIGVDTLFKKYLKLPVRMANDEIISFSREQLVDPTYARAYGLTFLATMANNNYEFNLYFKNIFKKIVKFFKKLTP